MEKTLVEQGPGRFYSYAVGLFLRRWGGNLEYTHGKRWYKSLSGTCPCPEVAFGTVVR